MLFKELVFVRKNYIQVVAFLFFAKVHFIKSTWYGYTQNYV